MFLEESFLRLNTFKDFDIDLHTKTMKITNKGNSYLSYLLKAVGHDLRLLWLVVECRYAMNHTPPGHYNPTIIFLRCLLAIWSMTSRVGNHSLYHSHNIFPKCVSFKRKFLDIWRIILRIWSVHRNYKIRTDQCRLWIHTGSPQYFINTTHIVGI